MLAEIGYHGVVPSGAYVPLEVELTALDAVSGTLSVQVYEREGVYDTLEIPVSAAAHETVRTHISVRPMRRQSMFEVTLTQDGKALAQSSAYAALQISEDALVVGVLGGEKALSDALTVTAGKDSLGRTREVASVRLDADSFPKTGEELSAFDVLAVDSFDLDALGAESLMLVDDWIRRGGFLLAGVGGGMPGEWLAERAGVTVGEPAQLSGAMSALFAYAGSEDKDDEAAMTVRALTAPEGRLLASLEGKGLLAASKIGDGVVMTLGVRLSDPQTLAALKNEALWQRLLTAYDGETYRGLYENRGETEYSYSLNTAQRVSAGVSIGPAALLTAAYVALAGFGLYALAKRRDRCLSLWGLLPVASLACIALIGCLGGALGLDRPAAATFTVCAYDASGEASAQEVASVSYASQERVRISERDGRALTRHESYFFDSWSKEEGAGEERDRIALGESRSIELAAGAPWRLCSLDVADAKAPEGSVTVRAWMDADGLRARIVNGTGLTLRDAALLTELGYVRLGDIAAGEEREALLERTQEHAYDEYGFERALPGKLLSAPRNVISIVNACGDPEKGNGESDAADLSEEERQARTLLNAAMNAAVSFDAGGEGVSCVLFALSDEPQAATLLLDGEPITRTAHLSIVTVQAAFETVGEAGHFYRPAQTFTAREATLGADGVPVMGEAVEERYAGIGGEPTFGFKLEDVDLSGIERILVDSSDGARMSDDGYMIQAYDFKAGMWTSLATATMAEMDARQTACCVNEKGELFLRYKESYAGSAEDVYAYAPQIIVEGSERR